MANCSLNDIVTSNKSTKLLPRIYVACMSAYNSGRLHGCWLDASQEAEAIEIEILEMLSKSPTPGSEEFAIHGATR